MEKLYIIGNGFDRFHGIPSGYGDFRKFVEARDQRLHDSLEEFFNVDELWSDFEQTLAYMDMDTVREYAEQYLVPYSSDEWSDADHHNYPYEVQQIVDSVTITLKNLFTEWALSLTPPAHGPLKLDTAAQFINFNYTPTLQATYGVPNRNVFHIHGQAVNKHSNLILGHGMKPEPATEPEFDSEEDRYDYYSSQDVRVEQGEDLIADYYGKTYKDTATIIEENEAFFKSLALVNEVSVLGHSLSPVDIEYFKTIHDSIAPGAKWTVTYRTDEDKLHHVDALVDIGVDRSNIGLITMDQLA